LRKRKRSFLLKLFTWKYVKQALRDTLATKWREVACE
jgi:hypothetical protein